MNWLNELRIVADESVNSPRLMAAVSTTTASIGVAQLTDILHGFLSTAAVAVGIAATLLLGRVHWQKYENEKVRGEILKRQLETIGVDPILDEETE